MTQDPAAAGGDHSAAHSPGGGDPGHGDQAHGDPGEPGDKRGRVLEDDGPALPPLPRRAAH